MIYSKKDNDGNKIQKIVLENVKYKRSHAPCPLLTRDKQHNVSKLGIWICFRSPCLLSMLLVSLLVGTYPKYISGD